MSAGLDVTDYTAAELELVRDVQQGDWETRTGDNQ